MAIGVGAGRALQGHPIIAVVVGVIGGMIIGLLVDTVLSRWARGGRSTPVATQPPDEPAHTSPRDEHPPAGPPAG